MCFRLCHWISCFALLTCLILTTKVFPASTPDELRSALDSAGTNRIVLERVIAHYRLTGDSLKLQAAYYLIANMEGHSYVTYTLQDTLKAEYPFRVLDYPDLPVLEAAFDSMQKEHGTLDFKKEDVLDDLKTIKSDFLVAHIELAFKAWREKAWAGWMNFDQFCEYVLPYRGSNEPLENWRPYFCQRYLYLDGGMSDQTDPLEAAKLINNDIMSWFKFNPRYYYHPADQGFEEMKKIGMGRCEDMTNLTIFAMRTMGIAVTSDYTPYWANSGNNHAWNAILAPEDKVIPFMGAEANPGEYRLANKLAKAYRKMFSKQANNLVFQKRKQEKIPGWLAGKSYIDVTADYVSVCDVTITFDKEIPDSVDIAYLCVFNSGEWKPIHWGRIVDGKATFTDMGRGIAYLPALYLNEKVVPFAAAFVLGEDCSLTIMTPNKESTCSISLFSTTQRKQEISTDGIAKSFLTAGQEYEFFFWENDWVSLGKQVAGEGPLHFDKAPNGSLFWLVATGSDHEERIFTIEESEQTWW